MASYAFILRMNGVLRFGSRRCLAVQKYFPGYVPSEHPPENTQHQVVIDKLSTTNLYLTVIVLQSLGCIKLFNRTTMSSSVGHLMSTSWLANASRSIAHQHSSRLNIVRTYVAGSYKMFDLLRPTSESMKDRVSS